jgi:hypothetical protein
MAGMHFACDQLASAPPDCLGARCSVTNGLRIGRHPALDYQSAAWLISAVH